MKHILTLTLLLISCFGITKACDKQRVAMNSAPNGQWTTFLTSTISGNELITLSATYNVKHNLYVASETTRSFWTTLNSEEFDSSESEKIYKKLAERYHQQQSPGLNTKPAKKEV